MTALEAAMRRGDWERAALCLLLGLLRAIDNLPPDSLAELLTLLAEEEQAEAPDDR